MFLFVVVSASRNSSKTPFSPVFKRKTGSGNCEWLNRTSASYQTNKSASEPSPRVLLSNWSRLHQMPSSSSSWSFFPQKDSTFPWFSSSGEVGLRLTEAKNGLKEMLVSSLPLYQVQSVHWQHLQYIPPAWSFQQAEPTENANFEQLSGEVRYLSNFPVEVIR